MSSDNVPDVPRAGGDARPLTYCVRVARELVDEMMAAPSRPVTLRIQPDPFAEPHDGVPVLQFVCTEHRCVPAVPDAATLDARIATFERFLRHMAHADGAAGQEEREAWSASAAEAIRETVAALASDLHAARDASGRDAHG
jgi:hypothetical protein